MGQGLRTARLIDVALRYHAPADVHYAGIDLLEARAAAQTTGLTLKKAHRLLRNRGIRAHIVPGDPLNALSRIANRLQGYELVLIAADQDAESLAQAWFYLPRMLAADCQIFQEQRSETKTKLVPITAAQLEALAASRPRRAAA